MIGIIGLSHKSAPLEVREQYAFDKEDVGRLSECILAGSQVEEVLILSTCNRTELYFSSHNQNQDRVVEYIENCLWEFSVSGTANKIHFYHLFDRDAVTHLFRLISGLESMVVGEYQIVSQIKDTLNTARKQGSIRQDSDINTPIERFNRTQIFDDSIIITGTQESVDQYGSSGLHLTLENAIKKKLERLYLELGRAIWLNPRVVPTDNSSEPVMGGLNWFIGENGQITSGSFSHANISAFIFDLFEMGLLNPEIWINPHEADAYRQLDSAYIQVDAKVTFAGRPLPTLLYTTRGQEVPIKIDPQCPRGQHFIIDPTYLTVHPLAGRQFFVKRAQDDDDNKKARIIGEYTMKVFNSAFMGKFTPAG